MKKPLIALVRTYQRVFSPDKGFFRLFFFGKGLSCNMYPTCSDYMILSIKKYGAFKGSIKGIGRIFRCHPFQKNLIDHP